MDLINGVMNFLLYVLRSVFSENVAGKVVLIAGASSGIGEHLAYEYARRGACLVLAARRRESLREVADRALLLGSPDAIAVHADISRIVNHLVNVAGETPASLFEETPDVTKLAPAMDINFWGYVYTTHFAVPHLRRSRGKIIAIASSAAWLNVPRLSFYGVRRILASKAAVISFYETLRVELGSDIGITVVTPGLIESEMTKGKFLDKEGRLVVNQVIRDVIIGPTPIETVGKGAEAIVNSACRGDKYLTEPSWYSATMYLKAFFSEIVVWLNRVLFLSPPGAAAREALSKKILDLTGLKKFLYPPSLLSPVVKAD
ncbi:hypothetical protein RJ640_014043 [Escallonia rubra]|uniref:11-beta-hydroxysteroid dehydrogenase 1B n=1 Tax=Escallonia rubra TaxID=112253 RepID=A0AA88UJT2_9ASTE|nr:hypothetical protein RJ640_014043 [Escallonia rubra]